MSYLLFFLFALICEILGTVGGFGSSVLFVPLAGLVFPRPLVLGLTSILHVFSNISKVVLFWKQIDWKLMILFGLPSLVFTIIGAWLAVSELAVLWGELILSIFLLSFSILLLLKPTLSVPPKKLNAVGLGSAAGFAAGFIGTGGALRGMALAAYNLPKDVFVGTSASIDFGVDLSRLFIYASHGFMESATWMYVLLLFIASWMGTWIGKKILERMSQDQFRHFVLLVILIIGIITLGNAVIKLV